MQAETHAQTIDTLNDLIQINNDRIAGYKRAIDEVKDLDADLKSTFSQMISESEQYNRQLSTEVNKEGGEKATGTTASGKVYRVWMDLKATFAGNDRKAVLESCEFGEDAAQRAYKSALEDRDELTPEATSLIQEQQIALRASHDKIKHLRDAEKNK